MGKNKTTKPRNCITRWFALPVLAFAPIILAAQDSPERLDEFVGFAGEDPMAILPTQPTQSVFGLSRSILETPRSVSAISAETIDRMSLTAVEDLVRVVPGVFTTTRFGIQGGIDVRNVAADTYFRGMRRLSLQGHARSVLAAMDSIEVIKGPPSPIYGMGKIGGYTNLVPKSGRARTGAYLESIEGFVQATYGSFDRTEVSFGIGGPAAVFNKEGGYYVYGLLEDSNSFARGVPVNQKIIQAAITLEDVFAGFRLETGINAQVSETAGALTGRFNQDLVDTGRYIRGVPLVNLDLNNNGVIGFREMHAASPVRGNISGANQPLIQNFAWPRDSEGKPLPLDQFPVIPGIPLTMYNYLVANPEADPTGIMRAQGVGGPLPISGQVPVGMVLDPRTTGFDTLDTRRSAAFERELRAELVTFFIDFINDSNPDFTFKNQTFFDSMDQYKISNQPFSPKQDIYALENKTTVSYRFKQLPDWLTVNSLASVNARHNKSTTMSSGGDFGTHRTDAMAPTWIDSLGGMTANTMFANPIDNPDINNDGYPFTAHGRTDFYEFGVGTLFDIGVFEKTSFILGARYDRSLAKNTEFAGTLNHLTGNSSNPGAFRGSDASARGWDDGISWSASVSHQLPYNIVPYITIAESSISLDGNNNRLSNAVINGGHIGKAELKEAGVKASLLNNSMFASLAFYEQTRVLVRVDDDTPLGAANIDSTRTKGWEFELKWVPTPKLFMSLYVTESETVFDPNGGGNLLVDARTLGFQDVVDANGNVVFPAEAFLYGGRSFLVLPPEMDDFKKKSGIPDLQVGFSAGYDFDSGFSLTLSGNHFSKTETGRLGLVTLPSYTFFNASASYKISSWSFKFDVFNIGDKKHFKPRTGETLGDVLAQAMPGRRMQFTVRYDF
ncbi:MAG: TonB-dependent receptor [Verrucomicrobia bacterium]|nr:TonB-dependent receptor [Verrucomicrobiota bacterium]